MVCVDARHVVNLMLTDLIPLFCTEAGLFGLVIQGMQLDLYKFMSLTGRACLHCVEYVVNYKCWIFKLKFSAINYCIGNEWKNKCHVWFIFANPNKATALVSHCVHIYSNVFSPWQTAAAAAAIIVICMSAKVSHPFKLV